jgi:predicted unusual protein kinase regulating ubiquinone biosynthesis (AarF/ABC1/UbiB family)
VAFFDGTLYPPEKFDVVLIDHGFHTDVPDAFRLTFCKTWAAVGLRDATLLAEAAFELGLSDDPGRTRVIQRRFNVSVPRARVSETAPTLRDRSER